MNPVLSLCAASVAFAALLPAQSGSAAVLPNQLPKSFQAKSSWLFPIHTQDADPIGGAYGTWACGSNYKASFHDGYAFYPVLGPSYPENLPLAWRNTQVRVGSQQLVAAGEVAKAASSAWRYEYRYAAVTEAYDVREDGVEQTFVIAQRPAGEGDLVVTGRIETKLQAESVQGLHGAITFRDGLGNPIVSYGAAFAIDANGTKIPMTSSYVGGELSLTLAAASLANAAFPLTVDPLTTSVLIATGATLQEPEIGRDDSANQLCFAYSRVSAGTDYDNFVRITANDYTGSTTIYSDITASWSTRNNQVAYVGGTADKWIVVFQRDFATVSAFRFIVNPSGGLATISTVYFPSPPAGATQRNPDVGGLYSLASSGSDALVVFQQDITATNANTANTEVFGRIIDLGAAVPVIGAQFLVSNVAVGTTFDREYPSVNQVRLSTSQSWLVSWQNYNNTISGDDWDIDISRITAAGAVAGVSFLAQASSTDHAVTPRVEGQNGRYMATYAVTNNSGTKYSGTSGTALECQRFDWAENSATPVKKTIRTLAPAGGFLSYTTGNIAYDTNTDSHWAITYTRRNVLIGSTTSVIVERCGYSGGTVEAATVYAGSASGSGFAPSVTFDDDNNEFKIAIATSDASNTLYARSLRYDPTALNVIYGTGCGGTIGANRAPNAGDEFWAATLSAARPSTAGALLISGAVGSIALDPIGMTGCVANVDLGLNYATSVNVVTSASGAASVGIPLIDYPAPALGNVFFQWVYFNPGANSANLSASRGMRVQVH